MTDPLALEVRRLQAEQAALREAVEHLTRRLLAADDRRLGAALVPLLGEMFDGAEFGAADVAAAALNGRDSTAQALRELVAEFCTESGGVRALGRVLARLEGVSFDGHRLQCVGERRGVQRWRVRVT